MDTTVTIGDKTENFVKFTDAMKFIQDETAYWNNFEDTLQPITIVIVKNIPNKNNLSIKVGESVKTEDIFGRP